jgi:hypothetical protein
MAGRLPGSRTRPAGSCYTARERTRLANMRYAVKPDSLIADWVSYVPGVPATFVRLIRFAKKPEYEMTGSPGL